MFSRDLRHGSRWQIDRVGGTTHPRQTSFLEGDDLGLAETQAGDEGSPRQYADVPGFCKAVAMEEIRAQKYVLTPGRYVGAAEAEVDEEPFEEKMRRLTEILETQFKESNILEETIRQNLSKINYVK